MTKAGGRDDELCYLSGFVDAPPCRSEGRAHWESTQCWDCAMVVGVG